jgi:hypothetical protein
LSSPLISGHRPCAGLLGDADAFRDLQPWHALRAQQDYSRTSDVASMRGATSQQPLQCLALARFEVDVSHARTNRACTRKIPLNSYAVH